MKKNPPIAVIVTHSIFTTLDLTVQIGAKRSTLGKVKLRSYHQCNVVG